MLCGILNKPFIEKKPVAVKKSNGTKFGCDTRRAMRRVVHFQIHGGYPEEWITVLCEDGTMWLKELRYEKTWRCLSFETPLVPQGNKPPDDIY